MDHTWLASIGCVLTMTHAGKQYRDDVRSANPTTGRPPRSTPSGTPPRRTSRPATSTSTCCSRARTPSSGCWTPARRSPCRPARCRHAVGLCKLNLFDPWRLVSTLELLRYPGRGGARAKGSTSPRAGMTWDGWRIHRCRRCRRRLPPRRRRRIRPRRRRLHRRVSKFAFKCNLYRYNAGWRATIRR
jgi:hypothetical protein